LRIKKEAYEEERWKELAEDKMKKCRIKKDRG
jgi:hypothetical protein